MAIGILIYSAAGPMVCTDMLQQIGQRSVNAAEANIILATEPVFAALLSLAILHEKMSTLGIAGGLLIVSGATVASGALLQFGCAWRKQNQVAPGGGEILVEV